MNGKLAFRSVLQGKNQGNPPFVPFVYGLAARMANVSLREMVSDPGYYTNALEGVYGLLDYEVITTSYDTTVEAESLGSQVEWKNEYAAPHLVRGGDLSLIRPEEFLQSGRIQVLLEVTKRLMISAGRDAAVACVISGPCSLLKGLERVSGLSGCGSSAEAVKLLGGFLNKLVRGLCELKIDAVLFREDPLGQELVDELAVGRDAYKGLYATLFNIVRAFNGFPLLLTSRLTVDDVKAIHNTLRPDGMVLLGTDFDDQGLSLLNELADASRISFGVPLPIGTAPEEKLWERLHVIDSFVAAHRPKRFFYTSDGEIPHDISIEILRTLMDRLRA